MKELFVVTERFLLSIWHLCAIGGCDLAMVSAFVIVPRMGEQCVGTSCGDWFVFSVKLRTHTDSFFQARIVIVLKTMVCVCGTGAF